MQNNLDLIDKIKSYNRFFNKDTLSKAYEFAVNASGHPFQIRVSNGGSAYNVGVTNNGAESGTTKFEVPFAAPNTLVYQCTSHSGMVGNIVVYPSTS